MWLAVISGILAILAFLPFKYSFIFAFFCLVPFFIFLERENKFWRLILGTLFFRLIFISGTVYYTLEPLAWLSQLLIFSGLAVSVFVLKKLKPLPAWAFFAVLPAIWLVWDLLQAQFSLLPSYIIILGNSLGSSGFLGLAGVGGFATLTFFALVINSVIAIAATAPKNSKKFLAARFAILLIIIINGLIISNFLLQKNAAGYNNLKNSLKITAVSANEKFDIGQFDQLVNELTAKKSDLVVLPEDILNDSVDKEFYQNLATILKTNIAATLTNYTDGKRYNSTLLLDSDGKILDIHNKSRLTFIGEYWPFGNWHPAIFDWVRERDPQFNNYAMFNPQNQYTAGQKKLISIGQAQFAALICLEIDLPFDLKTYKNMGAKFFINPSSNRWLNNLGKGQFNYLTANLKKIESAWLKIPIISAGVKDYAGITYPDGKATLIPDSKEAQNYSIFEGEIKF